MGLIFPDNSSGDLFRLLPFEGYKQVISFLPVKFLPSAAQVSKGWQYTVASRAKVDRSVTCQSLQDLTSFLKQLPTSLTAICCDVSRITAGTGYWTLREWLHPVSHLTWRCACFFNYHAAFMENFTRLKFLRLEFVYNVAPGEHVKVLLPNLKFLSLGQVLAFCAPLKWPNHATAETTPDQWIYNNNINQPLVIQWSHCVCPAILFWQI